MIVDAQGRPVIDTHARESCDHGVVFDKEEAAKLLKDWAPSTPLDFVMGNPRAKEVRQRWPRHEGNCPKGCGYHGIAYASYEHYIMGDW